MCVTAVRRPTASSLAEALENAMVTQPRQDVLDFLVTICSRHAPNVHARILGSRPSNWFGLLASFAFIVDSSNTLSFSTMS